MDEAALERQALTQKASGQIGEAVASFTLLTRLAPRSHSAFYNLGNTLMAARRLDEAVAAYQAAARLAPLFAPAHNNLGVALLTLGRLEEAAASLTAAAELDPANPGTRHLAGNALLRTDQAAAALPHLRAAHHLVPGNADIIIDLSGAYARLGACRDVAPLARQAAALRPDKVELWTNLAIAERAIGNVDASEAACHRALSLSPASAQAKYILATTLLTAGRLTDAWPLWESRWEAVPGEARRIDAPIWDGGALPGQVLYLHAEQGFGDTIQFCRYAPMAALRAEVVLAVQPPLLRLMRSLAGPVQVQALSADPPGFAAHAPLLSLPCIFRTAAGTVPAPIPYLHVAPPAAAQWAERLAPLAGRRIGLVWAGNPGNPFDFVRSVPTEALSALNAAAGVSWVSLQVAPTAMPALPMVDWTAELGDFADTAALVSGLDLVIGVDTAVVHLAGALGKPVWLLNRFDPDWRWGATGDSSAWYPTLRQFRQTEPGRWSEVLDRVCRALTQASGQASPAAFGE